MQFHQYTLARECKKVVSDICLKCKLHPFRKLVSMCKLNVTRQICGWFPLSRKAAQNQDGNDYHILLIITDGIITDFPETAEAIVNVSCTLVSHDICLYDCLQHCPPTPRWQ